MRLTIALGLLMLLSGSSDAFVGPSFVGTNHYRRGNAPRVSTTGGQWDNDDFLSALSVGGNDDAMEDAARYDEDDFVVPPEPEDVTRDQGGSRFQQMMSKAQEAGAGSAGRSMGGMQAPQYTPPPNPYAQQPSQQQQAPPGGFDNLSVEEQAALFRQFMSGQQSQSQSQQPPVQPPVQQPQQGPPPPKQLHGGLDAQGRKIGRNKDADTIANTADLYFAQLKRDSTIRTLARDHGDIETANAAMKDPSIKEVEETLKKNPYLTAQQERARSFVETSEDEMLLVVPDKTKTDKEESYTGVNFRQQLQEAKKKKQQANRGGAVVPPPPVEQEYVPPPVQHEEYVPPPPPEPVFEAPVEPEPIFKAPVAPQAAAVVPPSVAAPDAAVVPPSVASPTPEAAVDTSEETRQQIRTLMGLMLKHRGGVGFGKGRLQGPEAERFESLLKDTSAMLRSEAGMAEAADVYDIDETLLAAAPPAVEQPPAAAVAPPLEQQQPAAPVVQQGGGDVLDGTMACVEGAIAAYRLAEPTEKEGVLVSLRSALMAAVNSCNKVIAENEVTNQQTYQEVQSQQQVQQQQQGRVVEPNKMAFPETYAVTQPQQEEAVSAPSTGTMAFPDEYQVTQPEVEEPAVAATPVASQANEQLLSNIYEKLKQASGTGGEFGLSNDLSPEEANELADQLVEMRNVLMEELLEQRQ